MTTTVPKPRCKLNQMCWVKHAQNKLNIGRIVTTVEYCGYFQAGETTTKANSPITDHYWNVQSSTDLVTISGKLSAVVSLPDSWLTPVLPDEDALKYVLKNEIQDDSVVEYVKELVTTQGDLTHG